MSYTDEALSKDLNGGSNAVVSELENNVYYTISRFQRILNRRAEEVFSACGIAPSHAFILMLLNAEEELSAGKLASMLSLAPSTITRFADKLIQNGYCTRRNAGRMVFIQISDKGRALIVQISEAMEALQQSTDTLLSAESREQLIAHVNTAMQSRALSEM